MDATPPLPSTSPRRAARVVAWGTAIGAALLLGVPICPVAAITRHPCPGCGLTRATLALARGDVAGAVHLHPLAPVVSPIVVIGVLYAAIVYVREGRWPGAHGPTARWVAVVGIALWTALIAVWLARFHGAFGGPVPV